MNPRSQAAGSGHLHDQSCCAQSQLSNLNSQNLNSQSGNLAHRHRHRILQLEPLFSAILFGCSNKASAR